MKSFIFNLFLLCFTVQTAGIVICDGGRENEGQRDGGRDSWKERERDEGMERWWERGMDGESHGETGMEVERRDGEEEKK